MAVEVAAWLPTVLLSTAVVSCALKLRECVVVGLGLLYWAWLGVVVAAWVLLRCRCSFVQSMSDIRRNEG